MKKIMLLLFFLANNLFAICQGYSQTLGESKFIVVFDGRKFNVEELKFIDFVYEKMNEKLAAKKYNYQKAYIFKNLNDLLPSSDISEISFLNKIGFFYDCEFIIQIKKVFVKTEQRTDGLVSAKFTTEVSAYDNCSFFCLGTVVFESGENVHKEKETAIKNAISKAVDNGFDQLLLLFNNYVGKWVGKGAPYELRFYNCQISPKERLKFDKCLKERPEFGERQLIFKEEDYYKMNCKFKLTQEDFVERVTLIADSIPELKVLDLQEFTRYGRKIYFAPKDKKDLPLLKEKAEFLKKASTFKGPK